MMNDLARTNLPERSRQPVHFPEVPDYAIAALTLEWSTQSGHTEMPDNIITCTLSAYQGACAAWGIEELPHVLIYWEQLYLKAEHGYSSPARLRRPKARQNLSDLPSRTTDAFTDFKQEVKAALKAVLAQWGEGDRETYVAFQMPSFMLESAKSQLPEA